MQPSLKKNMLWNTVGSVFYLACQWLLSVVVVRVGSYSDAGILSLAMSVTNIFATVALFNVRNFQVSDTDGEFSDGEYVAHRHLTCISSLLLCVIFVIINRYNFLTAASITLYMLLRVVEAYADVYHGVAQKSWRLDIAGKSFIIRGALMIVSFTLMHMFFKNVALSLLVVSLISLIAFIVYDCRAVKGINRISLKVTKATMLSLSLKCLPLLIYGICTNAIVSSSRYLIEMYHGDEVLGYYATISTIAVLVQTLVTLIFTPLIGIFNEAHRDNDKRRFAGLVLKLIGLTVAITGIAMIAIFLLGDFAMKLIFGEEILPYTYLLYPAVLSSSLMALVWLFAMLLIVMRDFKTLTSVGAIGLAVSILISVIFIPGNAYDGANAAILISLGIICLAYFIRILFYLFNNDKNIKKEI